MILICCRRPAYTVKPIYTGTRRCRARVHAVNTPRRDVLAEEKTRSRWKKKGRTTGIKFEILPALRRHNSFRFRERDVTIITRLR